MFCNSPTRVHDTTPWSEGNIHLDTAFDFGVAKQELHSPQVTGLTVDQRRLRSPQ